MKKHHTTLSELRTFGACERGYNLIADHVGREFDGEISLLTILDNNGLDDCIWAMRAAEGGAELAVRLAIACALRHYKAPAFVLWAERWINGVDRTVEAAEEEAAVESAAAVRAWAAAAAAWAARAAAARTAAARSAAARAAAEAAARSEEAAERSEQIAILRELLK